MLRQTQLQCFIGYIIQIPKIIVQECIHYITGQNRGAKLFQDQSQAHDFLLSSCRWRQGQSTPSLDNSQSKHQTSDDSIYRKYRYIIFDIDISYCITSSKKYWIFQYIM